MSNYGGSVTNAASASITGGAGTGVLITGGAGTVVNAGTITGADAANYDGVRLFAAGSVTNTASASITGVGGVYIAGGAGTVVNAGNITGTGTDGFGVAFSIGGSVTNAASASIDGYDGIVIGRASGATTGTVFNYGSIAGTDFVGVRLASGGSVTNAASASITGVTIGVTLSVGGTLTNGGSIVSNGGTAVGFGGTGSNLLVLDPGYGFSGKVTGSTSASNTLELASAASAGSVAGLGTEFTNFGSIIFDAGANWTIGFPTSGLASEPVISGFAKSDTIDLAGINETIVSYSVGTLTLGGTTPLALRLPGSFTTRSFLAGTDHKGGTDVTLACFVAGTRIACLDGERTVETLVPGDFVRVVGAECAEIRWIGHRHIDCRRHPRPQDVQPVRVCADAFANGQPHRNLLLSPDHSVFIDGVLIPIRYLINGRTIVQERVDEITYWHIELPEHDVILAEGLPCESYLDTGNRGAFANGGNAVMLHPDFALNVWETQACAELVVSGPKLGAGKGMVLAQAETLGHRVTSDPGLSIVVDGRRLPLHVTGKTGHAILPPDVQSVRLVSRTWVPAHVLAGNDDTRSLGVAIANVRLDGKTLALDDPRLCSGWLEPESGWRWTDGDAGLALAGVRELTFDVVMTGSYWEAPGELEKVQRG